MSFITRLVASKSLLFVILIILFTGCNPALNITGMDISSIYSGNKESSLQINQLYNINDSISTISITIPAGLIQPDPGTKKYTKKGSLKYEVIGEGKRVILADSATFAIADSSENISSFSHSWTFRAPLGKNYFIKATYTVPGIIDDYLLLGYFSKKNHLSQSWFRFQRETGEYLPDNITAFPQPVRIVSEDTTHRDFLVKMFTRDFPTPYPPFVERSRMPFSYKPDSTFNLEFKSGSTMYFAPEKIGIYFFQADTSVIEGPSLFRMEPGFPKVTMHTQMLDALRYITSAKEFQQLASYAVPKIAVDSFWIANAGRSDIATELIRKYYQRVETANNLYTSYTEGWKTDRGMIFIVIGKPTVVYRSFEQEVWVYGNYDDIRALRFYFNKAKNPFTNNDYVLIRNESYKAPWYQSVQMWRR